MTKHRKLITKITAFLLLIILVFQFTGCSDKALNHNKKETVMDYESPENKKEMLIGGWFTPGSYLPQWAKEEYGTEDFGEYIIKRFGTEGKYYEWLDGMYKDAKEAGFNFMYYSNGGNIPDRRVYDALEYSGKNDIDMFVFLENNVTHDPSADYSDIRTFWGFLITMSRLIISSRI